MSAFARQFSIGEFNIGEFNIGDFNIGGQRPFIIAELSGNHNQDFDTAVKMIDAAAQAGVDAIKLQTYTADSMTLNIDSADFVIGEQDSLWHGEKLHSLYAKAATPYEWHEPLFAHAKKLGLAAFSSPFDEDAVDFLDDLGVPCFKIASFELTDLPLIARAASKGKPLIMSTGMASQQEIQEAVDTARQQGCQQLVLLKCTSTYPASPENTNLVTMTDIQKQFDCLVGLSDHTCGIGVSLASIPLGACVIEKHFVLDRSLGGVDAEFSMEPHEFKMLTEEAKRIYAALGKVQYGGSDAEQQSKKYRRSIYVKKPIAVGEGFTRDNIQIVRPAFGLAPKHWEQVLNSVATDPYNPDKPCNGKTSDHLRKPFRHMIAWFRTDASQQMGAGHLMRCLALAEALTEQHVECRFIMHADSIEFCHARIEWCWPKLIIPDDIRIDEEQHWLQNQITFAEEDILILDGYQFDATYINDLQTFAVPVLLFDDNNNRGEVTVQMVINSAANAESLQYETTMPGATFCLGDKFRLLRKEFRTELPQPVQQRHSIAIIMGGSDPKGLIIPLLKELHQQQSDYPVRVLVNSNYQPLDELKQKIPQWHFATQLVVNGADIANIFNNSKLVISAAGGTQFELMAMHTPAILLSVADNQVNATQQSELQGWCEHIDCREQTPFADIISRAQQLLEQPEKLQQMQNNAQQYADYDGVERLLDAILGLSDQPEATP